eukprot:TRINITY_DN70826_c0_g1_i1.p1 TRINITY_DN70826_c0_g1~~TRINITY_DN70826_c0_g1_i1.p1  ORF type:complete len:396 (+),score=61.21 TRINITY_DN70826_c0_g1_i1:71-1189(+)
MRRPTLLEAVAIGGAATLTAYYVYHTRRGRRRLARKSAASEPAAPPQCPAQGARADAVPPQERGPRVAADGTHHQHRPQGCAARPEPAPVPQLRGGATTRPQALPDTAPPPRTADVPSPASPPPTVHAPGAREQPPRAARPPPLAVPPGAPGRAAPGIGVGDCAVDAHTVDIAAHEPSVAPAAPAPLSEKTENTCTTKPTAAAVLQPFSVEGTRSSGACGGARPPPLEQSKPLTSPRGPANPEQGLHVSDRLLQTRRDSDHGAFARSRSSAAMSASGISAADLMVVGSMRRVSHGRPLPECSPGSLAGTPVAARRGPAAGDFGGGRALWDACSVASSELTIATSDGGGGALRRILEGPRRRRQRRPECDGVT